MVDLAQIGTVAGGLAVATTAPKLPPGVRTPARLVGFGVAAIGALQLLLPDVGDVGQQARSTIGRLLGRTDLLTQEERDDLVRKSRGGAVAKRAREQLRTFRHGRLDDRHGRPGTVAGFVYSPHDKGETKRTGGLFSSRGRIGFEVANYDDVQRDIQVAIDVFNRDTGTFIGRREGSFRGVQPGDFARVPLDIPTGTRDLPVRDELTPLRLVVNVNERPYQALRIDVRS